LSDVRLGKYHRENFLMIIKLSMMPFLKEVSIIISLVFHKCVFAYVDVRVEDPMLEDSNPRMYM